jgi:hypothetical protein
MFRVDREIFNQILTKIEPKMPAKWLVLDEYHGFIGGKGHFISNRLKLYAIFRFLAGGSHWAICCFMFKIGFGTFFADTNYGLL